MTVTMGMEMAIDKGRFLQRIGREVIFFFRWPVPVNQTGSDTPELVPLGVFDFLRDEVKCVPARVGVQGRVQRQSHVTRVQLGAFE